MAHTWPLGMNLDAAPFGFKGGGFSLSCVASRSESMVLSALGSRIAPGSYLPFALVLADSLAHFEYSTVYKYYLQDTTA
jgi:hypothetical protein